MIDLDEIETPLVTHIVADPELWRGCLDAESLLRRMLAELTDLKQRMEALEK